MNRKLATIFASIFLLLVALSMPVPGLIIETVLTLLCMPFLKAIVVAFWKVATTQTLPTIVESVPPLLSPLPTTELPQAIETELQDLRAAKKESDDFNDQWFKLYSGLCKENDRDKKLLRDLKADNCRLKKDLDSSREKVNVIIRYCNYYIYNEYGLQRRRRPLKTVDDLFDLFDDVNQVRLESSSFYQKEIERLQNELIETKMKVARKIHKQRSNESSVQDDVSQKILGTVQQLLLNQSITQKVIKYVDASTMTDNVDLPSAQSIMAPVQICEILPQDEEESENSASNPATTAEHSPDDLSTSDKKEDDHLQVVSPSLTPTDLAELNLQPQVLSHDLVETKEQSTAETVLEFNINDDTHALYEVKDMEFPLQETAIDTNIPAQGVTDEIIMTPVESFGCWQADEDPKISFKGAMLLPAEDMPSECMPVPKIAASKHVRFVEEQFAELSLCEEPPLLETNHMVEPWEHNVFTCDEDLSFDQYFALDLGPTTSFSDIDISNSAALLAASDGQATKYMNAPPSLAEITEGSYCFAFPSGNHTTLLTSVDENNSGVHAIVQSFNAQSLPGTEVLDCEALEAAIIEAGASHDKNYEVLDLAKGLRLWGSNNGIGGLWLAALINDHDKQLVPLDGGETYNTHYIWIAMEYNEECFNQGTGQYLTHSRFDGLCDASMSCQELQPCVHALMPQVGTYMDEDDLRFQSSIEAHTDAMDEVEGCDDDQMAQLLASFNSCTLQPDPAESSLMDSALVITTTDHFVQQQVPGLDLVSESDITHVSPKQQGRVECFQPEPNENHDREMSDLVLLSDVSQPDLVVAPISPEFGMSDDHKDQGHAFFPPPPRSDPVTTIFDNNHLAKDLFTPRNGFNTSQSKSFSFGTLTTDFSTPTPTDFNTTAKTSKPSSKHHNGQRSRVIRHTKDKPINIAKRNAIQKCVETVLTKSDETTAVEKHQISSQEHTFLPIVTENLANTLGWQALLPSDSNLKSCVKSLDKISVPIKSGYSTRLGTPYGFQTKQTLPSAVHGINESDDGDDAEIDNDSKQEIEDEFEDELLADLKPGLPTVLSPIISPEMTRFDWPRTDKVQPDSPPSPPVEEDDEFSSENEDDDHKTESSKGTLSERDNSQHPVGEDEDEDQPQRHSSGASSSAGNLSTRLGDAIYRMKYMLLYQSTLYGCQNVIQIIQKEIDSGDESVLKPHELDAVREHLQEVQMKIAELVLKQTLNHDNDFAEQLEEYRATQGLTDETNTVLEWAREQGHERFHEAQKAETAAMWANIEPVRNPGNFGERGGKRRDETIDRDEEELSRMKQNAMREKVYLKIRKARQQQIKTGAEIDTTRHEIDLINERLNSIHIELSKWKEEHMTEDGNGPDLEDDIDEDEMLDLEDEVAAELETEARLQMESEQEIEVHV